MPLPGTSDPYALAPRVSDPSAREVVRAIVACLVFVVVTRGPVFRPLAYDFDETGYLQTIQEAQFPKQHTLFLASANVLGRWLGDPYGGFLMLDVITSGLAMAAVWWMMRGLVPPLTAATSALALGVGPVFWSYGAMAANYTAIPAVGSVLLGLAWRGRTDPRPWHPYVGALVLALGAGYRQDIGVFWLPVLGVILWQHRGFAAIQATLLFGIVNLMWLVPMLRDAGGWALYRAETGKFAHSAGYLNSVFNLGVIDATARYMLKAAMALGCTLGIGLLFVPRGLSRVWSRPGGRFLIGLMVLAAAPALAMHLLVHFGVPGYAFHYVPAILILMAVGLGPDPRAGRSADRETALRGLGIAFTLAATFLLYPTNYERTGFRGDFDLAFARLTRVGLATRPPLRDADTWRTSVSQRLPLNTVARPSEPRGLSILKFN